MPIEIYSPHRPSLTCTSAGAARAHLDESGGVAWVWVRNPTDEQVRELGEVFALPEPAISEVINGGQHSKLKQYSNLRFLALHHAQSFDQLGDMYLFIGEDFLASVYDVIFITPVQEGWEDGDREGICAVINFDGSQLMSPVNP